MLIIAARSESSDRSTSSNGPNTEPSLELYQLELPIQFSFSSLSLPFRFPFSFLAVRVDLNRMF